MTNRRTTNKIMFLIMGITVASYLGNVRGAALRGGLDNLHKMLSLARQHALTYRSRTYVVFDQHDAAMGGTRSGYRIVAPAAPAPTWKWAPRCGRRANWRAAPFTI